MALRRGLPASVASALIWMVMGTSATAQEACDDFTGSYVSLTSPEYYPGANRVYLQQTECKVRALVGDEYYTDERALYIVEGNTIKNEYYWTHGDHYLKNVGVLFGPESKFAGDIAFNSSDYDIEGYWEKHACYDKPGWTDFWGNGCDHYAADFTRCRAGGFGTLAREACCGCNGGTLATTATTTFPEQFTCFKPLSCMIGGCDSASQQVTRKNESTYCNGPFPPCTGDWVVEPGSTDWLWGGDNAQACCDESSACNDIMFNGTESWRDSRGKTCSWYGVGDRCSLYGSKYRNWGYTASEACCVCDGVDTCWDKQVRGVSWRAFDSYPSDCKEYYSPSQCRYYGDVKGLDGSTANESCCECGGGVKKDDVMVCADLVRPGETEYRAPSSGRTCDDYKWTIDFDTGKCRVDGLDAALCKFQGMCPEQACCVCGGGQYSKTTTTSTTTVHTYECAGAVPCSTYGCPSSHPYPKSGSVYCRATWTLEPDYYNRDQVNGKDKIPECPKALCNHSKFCWSGAMYYSDAPPPGSNYLSTCCSEDPPVNDPSSKFCFDLTKLGTCSLYGCPTGYVNKSKSADTRLPCRPHKYYHYRDSKLVSCDEAVHYHYQTWSADWALSACCEPEYSPTVIGEYSLVGNEFTDCDDAAGEWFEGNLSDCIKYATSNGYAFAKFSKAPDADGTHQCYVSWDCPFLSSPTNLFLIYAKGSATTTTTTIGTEFCGSGSACTLMPCPAGYEPVPDAKSVYVPCADLDFGSKAGNSYFRRCWTYTDDRAKCKGDHHYHCWDSLGPFIDTCCTNATTTKMYEEKAASLLANMPRTLSLTAAACISGAGFLMTFLVVKFWRGAAPLNMQTPLIQA